MVEIEFVTVHYHYWLLGAHEDGRPCYVQDPTAYRSTSTCHRHAKAVAEKFVVLMCQDQH